MRTVLMFVALACSTAAFSHTPVCHCELNGGRIECEGAFHDGSNAVDVTMRVIAYTGETLITGKLDRRSRFTALLPDRPFYILMDVGRGEIFEVDWRDIDGLDRQSLYTGDAGEP